MLKFNTPQQIAENTIIDQIILATASGDQTISVNQFKGAVVVDPNLGNYVVIDFTVTDTAAMNIGRIRLMHGQTPVAISEDKQLLIVKEANKNLKIRLAAQFAGAEKCKFNTTSVNLPYATSFRDGVVRFTNGDEINKSGTVYSAADVDKKINQVTSSLGNLDQYAKKAEANTFAADNTFEQDVIVHGEIRGEAVATLGMNVNAKDAMVVSLGYADNKYLTKDTASSTYLSKNEAGTTYLTKSDASSTYLTQANATATYLTKEAAEQAAGNYAKLDGGNKFTGAKNTFQEVSVTKLSGDGVVDAITTNATQSNQSIPTDYAVKTYVDGKTDTLTNNITALQNKDNELQTKDNELQSQIDGINAGQNLADIVDTTEALKAYDVSHLKAKDDFQHGTSGAKWAIGDKVQVLGGADVQSSVYELIKGKIPAGEESKDIQSTNNTNYYWRYIGVYGTNAYTKSEINTKVDTINSAINTKADTSYVNTELAKKVDKTQITTTISGDTATDTNVASASAVKTYVDDELAKKANTADVYSKTEADVTFAQLADANTFTNNNTFNGTISGSAVTSNIATDAVNNGERLTTCAGVSSFVNTVVDNKITELQGGMSYLKLSSDVDQTVSSNVVFNGIISGTAVADVAQPAEDGRKLVTVDYANEKLAQLASNNNFAGETNTFKAITATTVKAQVFHGEGVATQVINPAQPNQVTTTLAVTNFVSDKLVENRSDISNKEKVGAMGLFLYTGGDSQAMGAEVAGASLQAVGMQLPMDGVVSWSQGAAMAGRWKLLNNTIAGEPCLVLAIRVE